jgi:hypothetical protein
MNHIIKVLIRNLGWVNAIKVSTLNNKVIIQLSPTATKQYPLDSVLNVCFMNHNKGRESI